MKNDPKEHALVAIVGKPNVGKSALFNRLIRMRKAIVAQEPGVTRDINYETLSCDGVHVRIADSAGYVGGHEHIASMTRASNMKLIAEANLILFVCDVNNLAAQDFELSQIIRKSGKPCLLVVNKVDNKKLEENTVDFFELGLDVPLPVSAAHGRNISLLKRSIAESLSVIEQASTSTISSTSITHHASTTHTDTALPISVSIVGKPNVGKSSLLNMLVQKARSIVLPEPGTTRDSVDETLFLKNRKFRFIDTAGLRKRTKIRESVEYYSLLRTEGAIKQSAVAILVIDAKQGITSQDKKIAWIISENKKAMIIAANKWDLMKTAGIDERMFRDDTYYAFPHAQFADIITVSAQTGHNKNTLLNKIIKVYNNYHSSVQTSELNSFIATLPRARADIKYGYQRGTAPPCFEFFIRNIDTENVNFKRYLSNSLRQHFDLRGVPIDIQLRKR
jgi:GTP-binding protein